MKTRNCVLLAVLLAMAGCGDPPQEAKGQVFNAQQDLYGRFRRYEFEGHRYITYSAHNGSSAATFSMVHDPDCPCHKADTKGEEK